MQLLKHLIRTILVLLLLVSLIIPTKSTNITDIVNYINNRNKIATNIWINLAEKYDSMENFVDIVNAIKIPQILINKTENQQKQTALYEKFNKNTLTIAWLTNSNKNRTFQMLDRLLWRIHFKDILLIKSTKAENYENFNYKELLPIFESCWSKGFISVLLWHQQQLYSYHPYPYIKVIRLENVSEFLDKSHLNDFQLYTWRIPFFEFPNLCYSYRNRQGQLVRTGYFYKWIQLYLEYYNASINHYFIDMWNYNYSQNDVLSFTYNFKISIMTIYVTRDPQNYEMSNVLHLTRTLLMVPNAKEISANLYLVLPYSGYIWLAVIVSGIMFCILLYLLQRRDLSKVALQAFKIIIFLDIALERKRSLKYFLLHLLFLFTGIFLTNYYTSNLSSLYAAKVYEPELKYLTDIERTNLKILEYSADVDFMQNLPNLPETIRQRFISGNNRDLFKYRKNLNMSFIYTSHEELMDFLLFQQNYLKHPFAKKLDQALNYRAQFITLPFRSPLIDHFNRYLSRIRENGMVEKFIADTKWDGLLSGYLTLLPDPEEKNSLTLNYFCYAFVIWFCGLLGALMAFLIELKICTYL